MRSKGCKVRKYRKRGSRLNITITCNVEVSYVRIFAFAFALPKHIIYLKGIL